MFTSVDRLFDSRSDFVPNLYDLSLYIVLSSFTHRRLTAQLFFGIGSHPGVTPGIKPPTLDKNQVYQLIQSHSDLRKDGGGGYSTSTTSFWPCVLRLILSFWRLRLPRGSQMKCL